MADSPTTSSYPTIEPASFDLIVSGTGLPESLLAAAAASGGKSVLHVDPNPFYGSHFSSLSPLSLSSFLLSASPDPTAEIQSRQIYSDLEVSGTVPEPSRAFSLDLHGPRLLFCADRTVDLLLKSGASHHVEFKSVDGSLIWWERRLCPVPDSRQAVFRDRTLGVAEKSQLMRFLRLVQAHIAPHDEEGSEKIAEEDLETPLVEFLEKQRLPSRIKTIVLYAIALADYDQESAERCKRRIKTWEGIESIALYTSSIGRFHNAVGAFIYPMYGHGELPQAFCRCAAVKGALYVLRMPMVAVLTNKENGQCKGVRLTSGQEIFSHHLVMDPSFAVPSPVSSNIHCEGLDASNLTKKVSRAICITDRSIQQDLSNILIVFPPKSLHSEQLATVRALQLSSNVAVCPLGFFIVYFSIPCDDAIQGKEYIQTAMNSILQDSSLNSSTLANDERLEDAKPIILWSAVYVQELTQASFGDINSCPMPDASLDYRNILESTMKLYSNMYPSEEIFPETPGSENAEEDTGSSD